MRYLKYLHFILIPVYLIVLIGCDENIKDLNPDYEYLKGTWIDRDSYVMQFIDFYSENQARFGIYSRNFEKYDTFNYRIVEPGQIAIDFHDANFNNETYHNLIRIGDDTIRISDLTIMPENPIKTYYKRNIITEKKNDTIILGINETFYDFNSGNSIQIDSILGDSRCPIGLVCFWPGSAEIRFELTINGNYRYLFDFKNIEDIQHDSLFIKANFVFLDLVPYPRLNQIIDYKDYKVKIFLGNN